MIAASLASSAAHATESMKYRVLWPENPPAQDTGWYILEWYDPKSHSWEVITQTIGTEMDGMLTYENKLHTLGEFDRSDDRGDVVCIRITAAKGSQRSTPSRPTCIAIPPSNTAS